MGNRLFTKTYIREVFLIDGTVLRYKGNPSYLRYTEPLIEEKEITDWKELLKELNYVEDFDGYKGRRGRIWCNVGYRDKNFNWCDAKVFKDKFVSAKITEEIKLSDLKRVKMKDLVNELNIEEFILFLKDNELSYVSGMC